MFFPSVDLRSEENLTHLEQGAVTEGFRKYRQVHTPNQRGKPESIFLLFHSAWLWLVTKGSERNNQAEVSRFSLWCFWRAQEWITKIMTAFIWDVSAVEANLLELHASPRAVDAQIVFWIKLASHLITESWHNFVLVMTGVWEAAHALTGWLSSRWSSVDSPGPVQSGHSVLTPLLYPAESPEGSM